MDSIIVYTDGACSGNPGPGGWAYVILGREGRREASGGDPQTTNNRMELIAVIEALKSLETKGGAIEIRTDSQYVKNGITSWIATWKRNGWRTASKAPVKNRELWEELDRLSSSLKPRYAWVEGHAGEEYNERCDALAREEIARVRG